MSLTVGVLGGLGPAATLDFFGKVLAATPARRDQEHLHLIIDDDPTVPDRNDAVAGVGPSPGPQLAAMARRLEAAGADFLVMVCNAAHAFEADIGAVTTLPFLSIIDVTVQATASAVAGGAALRRVGVLAAAGALDARLYERAFGARGIEVAVPRDAARARFMELLYRIKAGDLGAGVRRDMRALAAELIDGGAQAIVAGCTEVPLVLSASDVPVPLVASTDALVSATVETALGRRPLPGAAARRTATGGSA